ncbi:MAG: peptide ABC transporter [Chloroflexi bacterium RBG_13_51_18]|nr:MAG: peptide ABC transporter [Chloroflexi bacterium RBG_13_51_18]
MLSYIIRRLIQSVIVFFLITLLVFLVMRLLPGDPIYMIMSRAASETATEMQLDKLRHQYGLDRPMMVQYFSWLGGVFHGDLGVSILTNTDIRQSLMKRLPVTLHLGVLALIISFLLGVPMGIIAAVRRGTWIDTVVTSLANIGITIPVFWLALVLMYLFALKLQWLPVFGYTSPFTDFWENTRQIIMPVFCFAITPVAGVARQTRSSMLDVMRQDYIRTAWSKGLRERGVIFKHGLKNGLIPVMVFLGLGLSAIVGGSVLIETVFAIPGMGRLAVEAMGNSDYPVIQGVILVFAVMVLLTNLLVDLSYGWLDPRVQYR